MTIVNVSRIHGLTLDGSSDYDVNACKSGKELQLFINVSSCFCNYCNQIVMPKIRPYLWGEFIPSNVITAVNVRKAHEIIDGSSDSDAHF